MWNRRLLNVVWARGVGVVLVVSAGDAVAAAVVGNWDGGAVSWNDPEFADVRATATAAGHVVEADEPITAANLADNTHFVISEALSGTTPAESAALSAWVNSGGILMLSTGPSVNDAAGNAILASAGSSMSFAGIGDNAPLVAGDPASEGPPYNLVGQTLDLPPTGPPKGITGGNPLCGTALRFETLGLGKVYVFGGSYTNINPLDSSTVNGRFFLNLLGQQIVPEPSSAVLVLPVATLMLRRRERGRLPAGAGRVVLQCPDYVL